MGAPGPNKLGIDRQNKIFRNAGGAECPRYAVLVNGPGEAECQLPGAANAGSLAGVAHGGAFADDAVALSEHNYENIRAAAAIPLGSRVNVADAQGRVKALNEAAGTVVTLVGIAEEEATAADQEIVVNLRLLGTTATT